MVKNLPANAADGGAIPGLGRSHVPQIDEARGPQTTVKVGVVSAHPSPGVGGGAGGVDGGQVEAMTR